MVSWDMGATDQGGEHSKRKQGKDEYSFRHPKCDVSVDSKREV